MRVSITAHLKLSVYLMIVLRGSLCTSVIPTTPLGKLAEETNLCDDDDTMPLRVLLLPRGQLLGDLRNVLSAEFMRLGERHRLGLVAEQNVDVGQCRMEGVLEELADKRRREVHAEGLLLCVAVLSDLLDGRWTHGQVEALLEAVFLAQNSKAHRNVEHLAGVDDLSALGRLQMMLGEAVGGRQMR